MRDGLWDCILSRKLRKVTLWDKVTKTAYLQGYLVQDDIQLMRMIIKLLEPMRNPAY